jgi:serine/threonine protein kinase
LELFPSLDLRQYLQDNFVEIDWYQKISILLEIAKGLKAIHDHGYVHRDFHSGNVLLELSESFEGKFKILCYTKI